MVVGKDLTTTQALRNAISNVDMYKKYIADQKEQISASDQVIKQQQTLLKAQLAEAVNESKLSKSALNLGQASYQQKLAELMQSTSNVKQLETQKEALIQQVKDLQDQNSQLKTQNDVLQSTASNTDINARTLMNNQAACQAQNARLVAAISGYIDQINALRQTAAQHAIDIENLTTQVAQNNAIIAKLNKELDSATELGKTATQRIEELSADNAAKEQEIAVKQAVIDQCTEQIKALSLQVDSLQKQVQGYQVEVKHLIMLLVALIIVSALIVIFKEKLKVAGSSAKGKIQTLLRHKQPVQSL